VCVLRPRASVDEASGAPRAARDTHGRASGMTSRFTELTIDAHDPGKVADFWCAVLGYRVTESTDEYVEIASWTPEAEAVRAGVVPPTLVFAPVPEGKAVK